MLHIFIWQQSETHYYIFLGFEIGCVSSERYHKMCKMERNIADGIEFLKSIVKPANHWRQLLHMPTAKGTLLKR